MAEQNTAPALEKLSYLDYLKRIGPAFIAASVTIGPGSATTFTMAGGSLGYQLVWLTVVLVISAFVWQDMSVRLACGTDLTIMQLIRDNFGAIVTVIIGVYTFLTILAFETGNILGTAIAVEGLSGLDKSYWALLVAAVSCAFMLFGGYKYLEKAFMIFVLVMFVCLVGTVLTVGVDFKLLLAGLKPVLPKGSGALPFSMIGTTLTANVMLGHNYLVKSKGWRLSQYTSARFDTALSSIILIGIIGSCFMLSSAEVLWKQGIIPTDAIGMAQQIAPFAGNAAQGIFLLGLFAAGLTSAIAAPFFGITVVLDALKLPYDMDTKIFRITYCAVVIFGGVMAAFSGNPLPLIVFVQSVGVPLLPLVGIVLFMLLRKKVATVLKPSPILTVLQGLLIVFLLASSVRYILLNWIPS